ncbi:hypothetical protein BOX15_Mlig003740g1 [Macrostomum lignano]|uniref:Uncharacterized protein n=1 Tax=Macrostomum lignano TaxID=282301 RepID=A0A267EW50_9PLAT|nr:hypothetical protein BOX15_Mlig003740g1 [Macrostomum lignano]
MPGNEPSAEPTEDELISALASNNSGAVQSIISGGKCVDHFIVYKGKHFTPAMIACDLERTDLLIILIEAKVDLDRQNSDGISALYLASYQGFFTIVELLIQAQVDVNLQTREGKSSLFAASQHGHHQVAKLLIKAQADIDLAYCSPLYMAAQEGHCKVIESLVRAQAEVNLQTVIGSTPLYVASLEDRYQAVELLIKAQADVDLQDFDGFSPLYIASEQGYLKVVNSLIGGKADVNLQDSKGCSPIFAACQQGHYQVVESLLKAQADVTSANGAGKTPLDIASQNNHYQTVKLIIEFCIRNGIQGSYLKQGLRCAEEFENDRVVELFHAATSLDDSGINVEKQTHSDEELSQLLHLALSKSGFVQSRAVFQSSTADFLQDILFKRYHTDEYFVVGSFAEGWGNSLVTLDGRTDFDSDVDVMWLTHGKPFHLKDFCECADRSERTVEYCKGHILCSGFASNPARSYLGFNQRPTLDEVPAHRLCRYPPIAPLQPDRVAKSNIFPAVLQSIQRDVTSASSHCHIVHAAPPGKAGEQLRVSTSFLERRLLRSLTTLQGQMFVILKWLLKKAICHNGFRTYHAKTITFRMLEETPPDQWKSENLVNLTRRSLQILIDSVENACRSGYLDGRIMDHFFLSDAAVYLKGADPNSADSVRESLHQASSAAKDIVARLPELLIYFKDSLQPINEFGRFYFNPFLILSLLPAHHSTLVSSATKCEYHEIYDVLLEAMRRLPAVDGNAESLMDLIDKLPDCARSARESVRAIICLQLGKRDAAADILKSLKGFSASRGIDWPAERSASEATVEFVLQHLKSQDSVLKLCFRTNRRPIFPFRNKNIANVFPLVVKHYIGLQYMNFEALFHALRLELEEPMDAITRDWIRDVAEREDADEQELVVAVESCEDLQLLRMLRRRSSKVLGDVPPWLEEKYKRFLN